MPNSQCRANVGRRFTKAGTIGWTLFHAVFLLALPAAVSATTPDYSTVYSGNLVNTSDHDFDNRNNRALNFTMHDFVGATGTPAPGRQDPAGNPNITLWEVFFRTSDPLHNYLTGMFDLVFDDDSRPVDVGNFTALQARVSIFQDVDVENDTTSTTRIPLVQAFSASVSFSDLSGSIADVLSGFVDTIRAGNFEVHLDAISQDDPDLQYASEVVGVDVAINNGVNTSPNRPISTGPIVGIRTGYYYVTEAPDDAEKTFESYTGLLVGSPLRDTGTGMVPSMEGFTGDSFGIFIESGGTDGTSDYYGLHSEAPVVIADNLRVDQITHGVQSWNGSGSFPQVEKGVILLGGTGSMVEVETIPAAPDGTTLLIISGGGRSYTFVNSDGNLALGHGELRNIIYAGTNLSLICINGIWHETSYVVPLTY